MYFQLYGECTEYDYKCNHFWFDQINTITGRETLFCNSFQYYRISLQVVEVIKKTGSTIFSEPNTEVDLRVSFEGEHFEPSAGSLVPRDVEVLYLGSTQQTALSKVPLWRACVGLSLVPPHRLVMIKQVVQTHDEKYAALVQYGGELTSEQSQQKTLQEKVIGRMVLMEAALALGLSSYIAQYIVASTTHSNGYDSVFLLSDVKRVHEWAVRTSLQSTAQVGRLASVQAHIEGMSRDLTENYILPLLLFRESTHPGKTSITAEGTAIEFNRDVPVALMMELQSHILVGDGLKNVIEALLRRKVMPLSGEVNQIALGSSRMSVGSAAVSDVLQGVIEEATIELKVRLMEVKCLSDVLSTLFLLCVTPDVSFNCLHAVQTLGNSRANLFNIIKVNVSEAPQHLPTELVCGKVLGELCTRLHSPLLSQIAIPNTDQLPAVAKAVTNLLFLPLICLQHTYDLFVNNNEANVSSLEPVLSNGIYVSHSVVIYFLQTAFLLSKDDHNSVKVSEFGVKLGSAARCSYSIE